MKITGVIDRPKLEASLRKFAKRFGDTTQQAIARWGVSSCREAAKQTQIWGDKSKDSKDRQIKAMTAGAHQCLTVVPAGERPRKGRGNMVKSAEEANKWINENRGKDGRVKKMTPDRRKEIMQDVFDDTIKLRAKLAGIAKGAWLGAGMDIAKRQRGTDRINIGKNYLGYAQKHAHFGSSKLEKSIFKPFATLSNRARHSASSNVVKKSSIKTAMDWGLKKTVTWYRRAIKAQESKAK